MVDVAKPAPPPLVVGATQRSSVAGDAQDVDCEQLQHANGLDASSGHAKPLAALASAFWVLLWYANSAIVLVLNKHLLSNEGVDAQHLALWQLGSTFVWGGLYFAGLGVCTGFCLKLPVGAMLRNLLVVGLGRFATVALGLVALMHTSASFTETVKSSAPFFTVAFSTLILQQRTTLYILMSLVPIVLGLALTSSTDLSFDKLGFAAAASTNVIECAQNVFSKYLLQQDDFSPMTLQFYTSVAAIFIQSPIFLYRGIPAAPPQRTALLLLVDGFLFHCQSLCAYKVMDCLEPVSVSVLNALKRMLIIIASIWWFRNEMTVGSSVGCAMVIIGGLLYNFAVRMPENADAAGHSESTVYYTSWVRRTLVVVAASMMLIYASSTVQAIFCTQYIWVGSHAAFDSAASPPVVRAPASGQRTGGGGIPELPRLEPTSTPPQLSAPGIVPEQFSTLPPSSQNALGQAHGAADPADIRPADRAPAPDQHGGVTPEVPRSTPITSTRSPPGTSAAPVVHLSTLPPSSQNAMGQAHGAVDPADLRPADRAPAPDQHGGVTPELPRSTPTSSTRSPPGTSAAPVVHLSTPPPLSQGSGTGHGLDQSKEKFAVYVTSCNRFNLLDITLTSFERYRSSDVHYVSKVIIDDCNNAEFKKQVNRKFPEWRLLWTGFPKQMQREQRIVRAHSVAYNHIVSQDTEKHIKWIFWMEDDWKFLRTGFEMEAMWTLRNQRSVLDTCKACSCKGGGKSGVHPLYGEEFWRHGMLSQAVLTHNKIKILKMFTCGRAGYVMGKRYKPAGHIFGGITFNPGIVTRHFGDTVFLNLTTTSMSEADASTTLVKNNYRVVNMLQDYALHLGGHAHVAVHEKPRLLGKKKSKKEAISCKCGSPR